MSCEDVRACHVMSMWACHYEDVRACHVMSMWACHYEDVRTCNVRMSGHVM